MRRAGAGKEGYRIRLMPRTIVVQAGVWWWQTDGHSQTEYEIRLAALQSRSYSRQSVPSPDCRCVITLFRQGCYFHHVLTLSYLMTVRSSPQLTYNIFLSSWDALAVLRRVHSDGTGRNWTGSPVQSSPVQFSLVELVGCKQVFMHLMLPIRDLSVTYYLRHVPLHELHKTRAAMLNLFDDIV